MATKTIEARARITAEDATGSVFSHVAQKLRGLEQTAAFASRRMDAVARGMSSVGSAAMLRAGWHDAVARGMSGGFAATGAAAAATASFGSRARAAGAVIRDRAMETAAVAGATAAFAAPVVSRIVEQASLRASEKLRMEFAGMAPGEIDRTQGEAQRLARLYRPVGQTTIGKMIRDARTIAGDTEGALEFVEPLLKFRVQLQALRKGASTEQIDEELEKILRAADLMGATANLQKFTTFIEGVGRAVNVFGDAAPPAAMFAAAQHAGAASTQWSREFVSGVFPSLIQTMGGDTAGTALGSLFSALVGGRMKVKSAKLLNDLGLIDPGKIVRNKQGDVAGLMPGGLKGGDLALTNPYRYATEVVLPALTRKGVTEPQKITETLAGAYSDKNVAKLMTHMILNREQIGRDVKMAGGGMDLSPTVTKLLAEDLPTAAKGLTEEFNALAAAMGKNLAPQITSFANRLAGLIGERAMLSENNPRENIRNWIAGGIAAPVLGHLGLSALGGYFGGAGIGAGAATMMSATTPIFALGAGLGGAAVAGMAAYNVYKSMPNAREQAPSGWLENAAARVDRFLGIDAPESYADAAQRMKTGWTAQIAGGARSGLLGFGVGGPVGPMAQSPVAKLEGAASIDVKVEVAPTTDFLVKVVQQLQASGALRSDVGVTMAQ